MKIKLFTFLVLLACCAIALASVAQHNLELSNGKYHFQQAVIVLSNYNSKAEVERYVINDASKLDSTDFHQSNIMIEATLHNNEVVVCRLPNQNDYLVKDMVCLIPIKKGLSSDLMELPNPSEDNEVLYLQPYKINETNGVLTITIDYPFGDSDYNFPLEAKITITLNKNI